MRECQDLYQLRRKTLSWFWLLVNFCELLKDCFGPRIFCCMNFLYYECLPCFPCVWICVRCVRPLRSLFYFEACVSLLLNFLSLSCLRPMWWSAPVLMCFIWVQLSLPLSFPLSLSVHLLHGTFPRVLESRFGFLWCLPATEGRKPVLILFSLNSRSPWLHFGPLG